MCIDQCFPQSVHAFAPSHCLWVPSTGLGNTGTDDNYFTKNVYFIIHRLSVEPHDSLVQQLVAEAWTRLDR